jgi:glutathione S-transferase
MLKLYGFATSNYFSIIKHALLAKGIDHEEIQIYPNQEKDYLQKSPMGKVPCIETEFGCLSETSVILDYLEETYPQPTPLYPDSPYDRARVRQVMKIAELYLELPARSHLPELLLNQPRSEESFTRAKPIMEKALATLESLCSASPYFCGKQLTYADLFVHYAMVIGKLAGQSIYDWDILQCHEKLQNWHEFMTQDPIAQQIDQSSKAGMEAFLTYIQSAAS